MTTKEKLMELEALGYRTRIFHFRAVQESYALYEAWHIKQLGFTPSHNRGKTIVVAADLFNVNKTIHAVAECSKRDTFCKKIGRDIAVGRVYAAAIAAEKDRGSRTVDMSYPDWFSNNLEPKVWYHDEECYYWWPATDNSDNP